MVPSTTDRAGAGAPIRIGRPTHIRCGHGAPHPRRRAASDLRRPPAAVAGDGRRAGALARPTVRPETPEAPTAVVAAEGQEADRGDETLERVPASRSVHGDAPTVRTREVTHGECLPRACAACTQPRRGHSNDQGVRPGPLIPERLTSCVRGVARSGAPRPIVAVRIGLRCALRSFNVAPWSKRSSIHRIRSPSRKAIAGDRASNLYGRRPRRSPSAPCSEMPWTSCTTAALRSARGTVSARLLQPSSAQQAQRSSSRSPTSLPV